MHRDVHHRVHARFMERIIDVERLHAGFCSDYTCIGVPFDNGVTLSGEGTVETIL